jgi:uncharacterized protein (TIGR02391 family)
MTSLSAHIPDPEDVLKLEPEELAGPLLAYLCERFPEGNAERSLSRYNLFVGTELFAGYPAVDHERLKRAFMEAWIWLEREGLVAPRPGEPDSWHFITRRGRQLADATSLDSYRKANLLPKKLLHPLIAAKVYNPFLRGEYDVAVFQAFKEVEVAIRKAGNFGPKDLGTDLMRRAFDSKNGPLRDRNVPEAEREALAHLFAGAIGLYKNPGSHREVSITDPAVAVELIMVASHLLRIADERSTS